jgi:hypothetical protein
MYKDVAHIMVVEETETIETIHQEIEMHDLKDLLSGTVLSKETQRT